jgi:hypothetical protein
MKPLAAFVALIALSQCAQAQIGALGNGAMQSYNYQYYQSFIRQYGYPPFYPPPAPPPQPSPPVNCITVYFGYGSSTTCY